MSIGNPQTTPVAVRSSEPVLVRAERRNGCVNKSSNFGAVFFGDLDLMEEQVAVDAVDGELVSATNSLVSGNLAGK